MEEIIKKYEKLKEKVLEIGIAIPGRLRTMYHRCGRSYCPCMKSKEKWHGPYYLWDRKVNGKSTAKSIPEEDFDQYKEWIENRTKLLKLIDEIFEVGNIYATQKQDLKKPKKNQKK